MNFKLWKIITFVSAVTQTSLAFSQTDALCVPFTPYQSIAGNTVGGEPQDLVAVTQKTGIKSYNFAFVSDGGNCKPVWSSGRTVASGWGQGLMDRMRAAGIQYRISFGGAGSTDISKKCSVVQLINTYQQIINIYQPIGLDFDIENTAVNSPNIMTALKTIVINNPNLKISFTLPVMPSGLTAPAKNVVSLAKNAGLNYVVNIMTMDYGPSYSGDMGQYAIQAATKTLSYLKTLYPQETDNNLWQMIALTPMIGVNDIPTEIFTLKNTDVLNNFAQTNHLAWLSMWSLGRDKPCSSKVASSSCSGANAQAKQYEFSQHFLQCSVVPPVSCLPPTNISAKVSTDKKSVTINWQAPNNSQAIINYQVNDYKNSPIWSGSEAYYTDATLPGKSGSYAYNLYSICASGRSSGVKYIVTIP